MAMHIGLIDVDDTDFPNLVLMKLSAWHKSQGDSVTLLKPDDVIKGQNLFQPWDKLIGACVFTHNMPFVELLREQGADVAGIGTDDRRELPYEVEHIYPDYDLYGIKDTAYGFLSRGCPRGCPFCVVAGKEGKQSRKVADLSEWWHGQKKIMLCDPNLLACPERDDLLEQLADSKAEVDVNQGFDARLLTKNVIERMNKIKISVVHFAWDNPKDEIVKEKLFNGICSHTKGRHFAKLIDYKNNCIPLFIRKMRKVKVICIDDLKVYDSYGAAARSVGITNGGEIKKVCDGRYYSYKGKRFARLEDYENKCIPPFKGKWIKKVSNSL